MTRLLAPEMSICGPIGRSASALPGFMAKPASKPATLAVTILQANAFMAAAAPANYWSNSARSQKKFTVALDKPGI
jgi:hypothetical protein